MEVKTRYRKALKSHNEVAHVWAQQSQPEGRASRMFFDRESIYSYGRHFEIARFIDENTVLFNSDTYSPSTGQHQSLVRRAVSDKKVFTVPYLYENHAGNVEYFIKKIDGYVEKSIRARTGNKDWYLRGAESTAIELKEYVDYFNIENEEADKYINREFLSEESRMALKERLEQERKDKLTEKKQEIKEWIDGEKDHLSRSVDKIFLRRKGDMVQTSYGAEVEALKARVLWQYIKYGKEVIGFKIGYYTVEKLTDKYLKVGCHTIERSEIERFVKSQNWQ